MFPPLYLKYKGRRPIAILILLLISNIFVARADSVNIETETYHEETTYQSQTSSSMTTSNDLFDTSSGSSNKQWCGKNFEPSSPAIPPQGQFPIPPMSSDHLLSFGCTPAIQPYLSTDDPTTVYMIVDAAMTNYQSDRSIQVPYGTKELQVVVINTCAGKVLTSGIIGVNTVGNHLEFSLEDLGQASLEPYKLVCQLYADDQWLIEVPTTVKYLPPNTQNGFGNAVRVNAESGTLMVTDNKGQLVPFIPFGFFTAYDGYIDSARLPQIILDWKTRGINTVHPVPGTPYEPNLRKLSTILSTLGQAGFWVQYDLRHSYQNMTQVGAQLQKLKPLTNLLSYYTADEPDGEGHSVDAPFKSSGYIEGIDPYHPVSLTLNCEDYFFADYTRGTDIIMTDPYMVGLKSASFSPMFQTECNSTYGDCGCDNCRGQYMDLSYRLRVFRQRRHHLGKDRTMQLWAVPQAFGDSDYWSRAPTGDEFLLICTIYIIEGAVGLMGWQENDQTSQDLKFGSAKFGKALPAIVPFLGLPQAFLPIPASTPYPNDTLIARVWPNPGRNLMLVMVANLIEKPATWTINPPQSASSKEGQLATKTLYITEGGSTAQVNIQGNAISLSGNVQGLGCGAWIIPM